MKKSYLCWCGYQTVRKCWLNKCLHDQVIPVKYNFDCDIFRRGFLTNNCLEEHMKTHRKNITCQYSTSECNETFYTDKHVWTHMLTVQNYNLQPGMKVIVTCDHCEYKNTKHLVKVHMRKHSDLKECICPQCGKLLKTKACLRVNMLIHTGKCEFECVQCEKTFYSKGILNIHLSLTHGTSYVVCNEYCKNFRGTGLINAHMTIHTGEKRLRCREGCEKH